MSIGSNYANMYQKNCKHCLIFHVLRWQIKLVLELLDLLAYNKIHNTPWEHMNNFEIHMMNKTIQTFLPIFILETI